MRSEYLKVFVCIFIVATAYVKGVDEFTTLPGTEYCFPGQGKYLFEQGFKVAKPYPGLFYWGAMQANSNSSVDFSLMDDLVLEYQSAGFKIMVIALSTYGENNWGVVSADNHCPKPQYYSLYQNWVSAIVERYDKDGLNDMKGLLYPILIYEIGTEFSSYEPESAELYVQNQLTLAYKAAKSANNSCQIAHAAFFVPEVFHEGLPSDLYSQAYSNRSNYYIEQGHSDILVHPYSDLMYILNNGQVFDLVNFHSLLYPTEIDGVMQWLNWEMQDRVSNASLGYPKKIIVSDTAATPFISFGEATSCSSPFVEGLVFPPARSSDRCRLANYFTNLLKADNQSLAWVYNFTAADDVKRYTIAANNNVTLIDIGYTEDLFIFLNPLTSFLLAAGAGNPIWSGQLEDHVKFGSPIQERIVTGIRPASLAMSRLFNLTKGFKTVERTLVRSVENGTLFLYTYILENANVFLFWLEPQPILLPYEPILYQSLTIQVTPNATLDMYGMLEGPPIPLPSSHGFTVQVIASPYIQYLYEYL